MSYYHRESCRLCKGNNLTSVLTITPTPPANAFVAKEALATNQSRYPLELWFCNDCAHLQLLDIVAPEELFSDYVYVSGTSGVFIKHFGSYADSVSNYTKLGNEDLVVEIGSNDGTLLNFFREKGCRILGVDPARAIAEKASKAGIETVNAFFGLKLAAQLRATHGEAAVVTANNVFAHIDDLDDVTSAVKLLMRDDGLFVFEVSYLLDMYENKYFDMIYHEHLDYHSIQPLNKFFGAHGMEMTRVERVPTHGGSVRCYVQKKGGGRLVDQSVGDIMQLEKEYRIDRLDTFQSFSADIEILGSRLVEKIRELKSSGKMIAGFGAPAKATTLMYHFGLDANDISFIVDDSPLKQGLYTPGLHIPVVEPTEIQRQQPDYLLVLAWNFADSIIEKNKEFSKSGGRFIVPLPELRIV